MTDIWQPWKAKLTRAEKIVRTDPLAAIEVAEAFERFCQANGWPDWWSRVDRLRHDAEFAARDIAELAAGR